MKVLSEVKNKLLELKQDGFGLLIATLITCSFFHYTPLFFKSIWPWLTQHIPQQYLIFVVGTCVYNATYLSLHLFMYVIYKLNLPVFEKQKIYDKLWPWESDPEAWRKLLKRTLKTLAFLHLVAVPLYFYLEKSEMRTDLESWPDLKEIMLNLLFCMWCEDFYFYWSHRLLHNKYIYPYIHKVHHEYSIAISIGSEHAHPIEHLVENLFPLHVFPLLLGNRIHAVSYYIWVIVRMTESIDSHTGYDFSWSPLRLLPFSGSSDYHAFHHHFNTGNYGSFFTFWDNLCGTNKCDEYLASKQKKKLAEIKRDLNNDVNANVHARDVITKIHNNQINESKKVN